VARTIVASQPDLIFSAIGTFTHVLKPLTTTIPIVTASSDPIVGGLVTNLAKPEGNITGVSVDAGVEVAGKRLQFLRETTGKLTNVGLLMPPSAVSFWNASSPPVQEAAHRANIRLSPAVLSERIDREAYERVFDAMEKEGIDGVMVGEAGENTTYCQVIVDLAAKHRLPAVYPTREYADVGGLLSYGPDLAEVFRRLADMVDQILRGAKPGDIPYQQQTKFELVLNRTTARSLGLEFPASLLAVADEVIE
jgi:putative ABC transport system substrate-binding protein